VTDEAIQAMLGTCCKLRPDGAAIEVMQGIKSLAQALDDHKATEAKLRSALDLLTDYFGYTGKVAKAALAGADLRDPDTLQKVACGSWEKPNV